MKKIFVIIILSLFAKAALAETSLDYMMSKKGSMDIEIRCTNNQSGKSIITGFKNINNKIFKYDYFDDDNMYSNPTSTVKVFNKKLKNTKVDVYFTFAPLMPEFGLGNGFVLSIFLNAKKNAKETWQEFSYFVKDDDITMFNEWSDLAALEAQEHDNQLYNWSEKAFLKISKKLGFGKPFELVDLDDINQNGLIGDGKGNFYMSNGKCKKL